MSDISRPQLLSEFSVRLSHALRGPLAVALAALKDAACGTKLTEQELQDGVDAVERAVEIVDNLRGISKTFSAKREPTTLKAILGELPFDSSAMSADDDKLVFSADREMLQAAFRYIIDYLDKRTTLPSAKIFFRIEHGSSGMVRFTVDFCLSSDVLKKKLSETTHTLVHLAQADHSVEAVGLFFAEEVFHYHQGSTEITNCEAQCRLEIHLPLKATS